MSRSAVSAAKRTSRSKTPAWKLPIRCRPDCCPIVVQSLIFCTCEMVLRDVPVAHVREHRLAGQARRSHGAFVAVANSRRHQVDRPGRAPPMKTRINRWSGGVLRKSVAVH